MSKVTDLLRAEGIPDSFLTILAGMSLLHAQVCAHVHMYNYVVIIFSQRTTLMESHWLLCLKTLKNSSI